jgi:hypothetical protein
VHQNSLIAQGQAFRAHSHTTTRAVRAHCARLFTTVRVHANTRCCTGEKEFRAARARVGVELVSCYASRRLAPARAFARLRPSRSTRSTRSTSARDRARRERDSPVPSATWCDHTTRAGRARSYGRNTSCTPKGIRTPVTRMRTWRPRPLDDGGRTNNGSNHIPRRRSEDGREVLGGKDSNLQPLEPESSVLPVELPPIGRPIVTSRPARPDPESANAGHHPARMFDASERPVTENAPDADTKCLVGDATPHRRATDRTRARR